MPSTFLSIKLSHKKLCCSEIFLCLFSNQKSLGLILLTSNNFFLYGDMIDNKKGLGLKKTCAGVLDIKDSLY